MRVLEADGEVEELVVGVGGDGGGGVVGVVVFVGEDGDGGWFYGCGGEEG